MGRKAEKDEEKKKVMDSLTYIWATVGPQQHSLGSLF